MQIPFTTYQAYNGWGGKSTYGGVDGIKADKVSFDRPYNANGGTEFLFIGDHQMISWLERNGYPVSYAASSDTHSNPGLLNNRKMFFSVYHDEYWTQSMRNNLTSWIANGKSMAMLSANNIYWRVRFEPNAAGLANRTMVAYKDAARDPVTSEPTILFSETGQSESQIEGLKFGSFGDVTAPWIVTNASHWIYAGTGVTNGTAIAGLVGTEWDQADPAAPAGTQLIASSPTVGVYGPSVHAAAVREPTPGQVLFSVGTIRFPMFFGGFNSPGEDARVTKMTTNVFNRVGIAPFVADTTNPTVTVVSPTAGQAMATKPVIINGTAADNVAVAGVQVAVYRPIGGGQFWNGASWQASYTAVPTTVNNPNATSTTWTYNFNPPQTGGYFYVAAMAYDPTYNYSLSPFSLFTLPDTTPPNATVTPANGVTTSGPIAIGGTTTDNSSLFGVWVAVYRISTAQFWNGTTWQSGFATVPATLANPGATTSSYTYSFSPPSPGSYLIGSLPIDANYNYSFVGWNTITAS